jgi:hypothetical protein
VTGEEERVGKLVVSVFVEGLGFGKEDPRLEIVHFLAAVFAILADGLLTGDAGFQHHGEIVEAHLACRIVDEEFQSPGQEGASRVAHSAIEYKRRRLNDHLKSTWLIRRDPRRKLGGSIF